MPSPDDRRLRLIGDPGCCDRARREPRPSLIERATHGQPAPVEDVGVAFALSAYVNAAHEEAIHDMRRSGPGLAGLRKVVLRPSAGKDTIPVAGWGGATRGACNQSLKPPPTFARVQLSRLGRLVAG